MDTYTLRRISLISPAVLTKSNAEGKRGLIKLTTPVYSPWWGKSRQEAKALWTHNTFLYASVFNLQNAPVLCIEM